MWAKASALGLFAIALASLPSDELSAQSALEQAKKIQSQSSNATRGANTTERSSNQARGGFDTRSTTPPPVAHASEWRSRLW